MLFGLRPRRADEELSKIYDQNAITPAVRGTTSSSLKLCIFLGHSTALVGPFLGVYVCSRPLRYTAYIVIGVIILSVLQPFWHTHLVHTKPSINSSSMIRVLLSILFLL
jgi:hypothetical protein